MLLGRLTLFEGGASLEGAGGLQRRPDGEPRGGRGVARRQLVAAATHSGRYAEPAFGCWTRSASSWPSGPPSARISTLWAAACPLLPGLLRARGRAGGANGSPRMARPAGAGARQHPSRLRAAPPRRRGRRGASAGDRVRARAALGRPRTRGPGLARTGPGRRDAGVHGTTRQRPLLGRRACALPGPLPVRRARLEAAVQAARDARDAAVETASLSALGRCAVLVADPEAARICEEAVAAARRIGDPLLMADALLTQAGACERAEEWDRAGPMAGEALRSTARRAIRTASRRRSPSRAGTTWSTGAWSLGAATGRGARAAPASRRRPAPGRAADRPRLAHAGARRHEEAAHGFLDCLRLARQVDDQFNVGEALAGLSTQAAPAAAGRRRRSGRRLRRGARAHRRAAVARGHRHAGTEADPARGALGDDASPPSSVEGRGLSAEEAVALWQSAPAEL